MTKKINESVGRLPLWIIYLVACFSTFGFSELLTEVVPADGAIPITNQFKDPAKAILDSLMESVRSIATLNTAAIGAAGALAIKGRDWSKHWGRLEATMVLLVFIGCALSYYGVYVSYSSILSMVAAGTIFPFESRLQLGMDLQYYGTLAGVFLLGLVFTRMLAGRLPAGAGNGSDG